MRMCARILLVAHPEQQHEHIHPQPSKSAPHLGLTFNFMFTVYELKPHGDGVVELIVPWM